MTTRVVNKALSRRGLGWVSLFRRNACEEVGCNSALTGDMLPRSLKAAITEDLGASC
jgi:hypothetical protein